MLQASSSLCILHYNLLIGCNDIIKSNDSWFFTLWCVIWRHRCHFTNLSDGLFHILNNDGAPSFLL